MVKASSKSLLYYILGSFYHLKIKPFTYFYRPKTAALRELNTQSRDINNLNGILSGVDRCREKLDKK